MRDVENRITYIKQEKYDSLTKPVCAFITFEEEDGSIVAQEYEAKYTITG